VFSVRPTMTVGFPGPFIESYKVPKTTVLADITMCGGPGAASLGGTTHACGP
jgi:hypothetical protein